MEILRYYNFGGSQRFASAVTNVINPESAINFCASNRTKPQFSVKAALEEKLTPMKLRRLLVLILVFADSAPKSLVQDVSEWISSPAILTSGCFSVPKIYESKMQLQ
jgi:hypothetical protein